MRQAEPARVVGLRYVISSDAHADTMAVLRLALADDSSPLAGKEFEVEMPPPHHGQAEFIVLRSHFDAAVQREWRSGDKCQVGSFLPELVELQASGLSLCTSDNSKGLFSTVQVHACCLCTRGPCVCSQGLHCQVSGRTSSLKTTDRTLLKPCKVSTLRGLLDALQRRFCSKSCHAYVMQEYLLQADLNSACVVSRHIGQNQLR